MKKVKYHYEWAAYTDNLCWGRMLIARDRSQSWVRYCAVNANKGAFIIVKERVYETNQ